MSKKIKIPTENIKSRLCDLFHSFMSNRPKVHRSSRYIPRVDYDDMDDDELMYWLNQGFIFEGMDGYPSDYDGDDDGDVIWPLSKASKNKNRDPYDEFWEGEKRKSKHKRNRHKSTRARIIDLSIPFSGDEENPRELVDDGEFFCDYEEIDDNGMTNGKEIYYYPDYHNKDSRLEFTTLSAFNEFCEDNGYTVPMHIANDITYRRVSHTCLNPEVRDLGLYEIMAEESYGSMFYEVCEASELGG